MQGQERVARELVGRPGDWPQEPTAHNQPQTQTTPAAAENHWGRYTHRQIQVIYSGLMLGMMLAALDQMVVSTALPTIVGELGDLQHLSWVVTAYLLTSTASTLLYGKLGDLLGRKKIFQIAIFIFLVGSVFSGLAQNMGQLIGSRALQGAGAGGLMALSMAIIADVVSPRERGRYQGYNSAVFAFASIVGPFVGGLFTDHLTWRWIFFINLPVGIAALFMSSVALRETTRRIRHVIDYFGSVLMTAGVSGLMLVLTWGGVQYAWTSASIIGLGLLSVACLAGFVLWEMRAPEPILPMHLFRDAIFNITTLVAFLVASCMFGALVFLPLFLQLVSGVSATNSGLLLAPQALGMIVASVTAGRIISSTGKYKAFPLWGLGLQILSFFLLATMTATTSQLEMVGYMMALGVGMGLTLPTLTTAMQNAVEMRHIGIATSVSQFARSMGSAIGVTFFGAIMNDRLAYYLPRALPASASASINPAALQGSPQELLALPPAIRFAITDSFARSLHVVFMATIPVVLAALIAVFFLEERPLRGPGRRKAEDASEAIMSAAVV